MEPDSKQPAESNAKQPVTVRLDPDSKAMLVQIFKEGGGTVSEQVNNAVREYLEQRFLSDGVSKPRRTLRVRHASLPDTSILAAFDFLAPEEAAKARQKCRLVKFDYLGHGTQWRLLKDYLNSPETDLLESVNWSAIFSIMKEAKSSPALDWTGPYLQLFAGHCVFVRKELLERSKLTEEDLADFEKFRGLAQSGREQSLRSVVAWLRQTEDEEERIRRTEEVEVVWRDAIVTCQLGTDYEIAVKRVSPILNQIYENGRPNAKPLPNAGLPRPGGDDNPADFCTGVVEGFSGNLLHSAQLLSDEKASAYLLAGPADLRIQSINVLAGKKGMFISAVGPGSPSVSKGDLGKRVLEYWSIAVRWFRTRVIGPESDHALLPKFLQEKFREFQQGRTDDDLAAVGVLRSLMQSWVKWFADPAEAEAYLGEEGTKRLVRSYERLCDMLNPLRTMTAPIDDPKNPDDEESLWKFATLPKDESTNRQVVRKAKATTSDGPGFRGSRRKRKV